MTRNRSALLGSLIVLTLSLSACIGVSRSYEDHPTLGQQLIDLKAAYDQGAMTESEYERAKAKLISDAD